MIREVDIGGVYLSPMLIHAAVAALIWLGLSFVFESTGLYRWVWHRSLFNLAVFVIVLAVVVTATL
jgi:hypothetical protein